MIGHPTKPLAWHADKLVKSVLAICAASVPIAAVFALVLWSLIPFSLIWLIVVMMALPLGLMTAYEREPVSARMAVKAGFVSGAFVPGVMSFAMLFYPPALILLLLATALFGLLGVAGALLASFFFRMIETNTTLGGAAVSFALVTGVGLSALS